MGACKKIIILRMTYIFSLPRSFPRLIAALHKNLHQKAHRHVSTEQQVEDCRVLPSSQVLMPTKIKPQPRITISVSSMKNSLSIQHKKKSKISFRPATYTQPLNGHQEHKIYETSHCRPNNH